MAIYCAKCGSKVGVTGPCKTCQRKERQAKEQFLSEAECVQAERRQMGITY